MLVHTAGFLVSCVTRLWGSSGVWKKNHSRNHQRYYLQVFKFLNLDLKYNKVSRIETQLHRETDLSFIIYSVCKKIRDCKLLLKVKLKSDWSEATNHVWRFQKTLQFHLAN